MCLGNVLVSMDETDKQVSQLSQSLYVVGGDILSIYVNKKQTTVIVEERK